ncbi:MAG: hypothetical protein AAGE52_37205 [Myxococcota bacterium]
MPKNAGPPKRRIRNYLLDPRFQLKYTGMVVGVTVVIASLLGWYAYDHSRGQTEAMSITMSMQPDLHPDVAADLEGWAQAEDRQVLIGIVIAILLLAVALGVTGILVTHKLVGPAYKMKLLFRQVEGGKLKLAGRLRKGDELQDVFEAFANMVESLREAQTREVAELDAAIKEARAAGTSDEAIQHVVEVRNRMQAALDD